MRWLIPMAGILLALEPIAAQAAEAPRLFHITCPGRWPGVERRGTRLSYAHLWFDAQIPFGPWDVTIDPPNLDTTVLIDCAYGKGGPNKWPDTSPLRITVAVPGHVQRCSDPVNSGNDTRGCTTAPEADGTIGPVKLYIAEPITLATTLLGFGLRHTRDEVLATAASAGFACGEDRTATEVEAPQTCTRGADRVTVHFKNGRSAKVRQFGPSDTAEWSQLYQGIVVRFGLLRTYGDAPEPAEIWQQPGSAAAIAVWPGALTLSDTEAAK